MESISGSILMTQGQNIHFKVEVSENMILRNTSWNKCSTGLPLFGVIWTGKYKLVLF